MSQPTTNAPDNAAYASLINGLSTLCKVPASAQNHQRLELTLGGTLMTLIPATEGGQAADGITYFAEVAQVHPKRREATAVQMLQTNLFLVGREAPKFCLNPVTGRAVLTGYLSLDRHGPESAHKFFIGLGKLAEQFRNSDMLKPKAEAAGSSRAAARPAGSFGLIQARRP